MSLSQNQTVLLISLFVISFFYNRTVLAQGSDILTITTDPSNASQYIDGQVPLQRDYCKLTVSSKPDSSEVFLLTPIGKTPIIDGQIDQGTYTLEIRSPNHRFLPLRKNNIYIDKNNPGIINDPLSRKKIFTKKAWLQIGLGLASVGFYSWSFNRGFDNKHENQSIPGFILGTTLLTSLGIITLF